MGPPRAACKRAHVRARIGLIALRDNKPAEAQQMFSNVRQPNREQNLLDRDRASDLDDDRRESTDNRSYGYRRPLLRTTRNNDRICARANYQ
jgi:hypothetical protein